MSFARLPLMQRLDALFGDGPWRLLPATSDLAVAVGAIGGREIALLATDPQRAKGTLGPAECATAVAALERARAARQPLLLLIDSAGARLDAGLAIQGALRALLREALDARADGLPLLAMLGRHAFGGASLLAFAAQSRYYSAQTLLAMSGPRLLHGADGRALAHAEAIAAICGEARAAQGGAEQLLGDADAWVRVAADWAAGTTQPIDVRKQWAAERELLRRRLGAADGDDAVRARGATLVLRSELPLGAAAALALVVEAERAAQAQPGEPLLLEVDCPGHSLALADERLLLSQYLAHLALSLRFLVRAGTPLRLRLQGEISGGVYAALAGAVTSIELGRGALVRTLPSTSLAHIGKEGQEEVADPARYLALGIVDQICPAVPDAA